MRQARWEMMASARQVQLAACAPSGLECAVIAASPRIVAADVPQMTLEASVWGDELYPYTMVPGYAGYGLGRVDRAEREREEEAYLRAERARHRNDDPHLRSCKAVTGYHIHATDGEIGHVAGYLVDDETWAILYLIVDTSNWWVGHKVLIAPAWITGVHWSNQTVSVNLSCESAKSAPVYDPDAMWSRELDRSLYQHYGRTGYWSGSALAAEI